MPKPRRLIVVGNLTVRHYVLHRNGFEVPQWVVTSKDGKHVSGPFSSLEEVISAAKEAGTWGSEKGSQIRLDWFSVGTDEPFSRRIKRKSLYTGVST